ncbi:inositol hexakisphosphate kinase 2-like [Lineus longissimus]|uniref:inositol hexakisphosphate kinase 2-like n=1 Tax=Lineus longissimus TaxID=88925 RepID=UPI002B4C5CE4
MERIAMVFEDACSPVANDLVSPWTDEVRLSDASYHESGMSDDSGSTCLMQPFVHQVGGHSNMFTYEGNTVCKPLFEKEYNFYRQMPEEMRPFAPICEGNFDVMLLKDADSQVRISIVSPIRPLQARDALDPDTEYENGQFNQGIPEDQTERPSTVFSNTKLEKNPWSVWCHKRMYARMDSDRPEGPKKYIILKNAVIGFKAPSILDLKMGTRQHGLDDTEYKIGRKTSKCLSSTSCTLGFRVGGMQVYQRTTGNNIHCDKFMGEAASKDTVHKLFQKFLSNGVRLRLEVIDLFVEKLRAILKVMVKRCDVRMFSSSLMMVYEGIENPGEEGEDLADGRVVEGEECSGSDDSNLIQSFPSSASYSAASSSAKTASGLKVEIKMIDFAQSFHTASRTDVKFVGPDIGYIYGLESLIKIFLNVKERYKESW